MQEEGVCFNDQSMYVTHHESREKRFLLCVRMFKNQYLKKLYSYIILLYIFIYFRLWALSHRYYDTVNRTCFFMNNDWVFINNNVELMWNSLNITDQRMFCFDMKEMDWTQYFDGIYKGVRLYLFKEDDRVLESARVKMKM